ncbi:MAG: PAAR domain-containing protein [Methylococcaceae bacterium]|nr:PAAR domain-containing protein [Methylococcaceae bacterium]
MGKPAARLGDMHVCPKVEPGPVPHVGGPILEGSPDVFINDLPAARVGDAELCVGPTDKISSGSPSVFINWKPAARMGDSCAHGGKITIGSSNVFIGDSSSSGFQSNTMVTEINDPPLESVPILPVEELAQGVQEIVKTLQEKGLSIAAVGSVAADVVLRKVDKVIPVKQLKNEIEAFGERALAKYKALTGKTTHPDFNRRYHGPDDLLKIKNNRLEEVEVKATANPASKPVPKKNTAGKQGSAANNKKRGATMAKKLDRNNYQTPSNRIGGVYTESELKLWKKIRNSDGSKQHTFIRANQSTNKAEVFPQDEKGKLGEKLFDFDVD